MIHSKHRLGGFTIVELLVVIVVIGIIAGITIVSYTAITNNAKKQTAKTDAQTMATQLNKYKSENGAFPTDLSALSNTLAVDSTFQYTYNSVAGTYCLTASVDGASAYVRSGNSNPQEGGCAGHGVNGLPAVTNFASNPNATSLTGYSSAGATGTTALQTSGGQSGADFIRRSFTAAGSGGLYFGNSAATLGGLEASKTYTASGWVRASKAVSLRANIEWKNSAGTQVGTSPGAYTTVDTNWTRLTATGVAPANTTRATITFYANGSLWANLDTQDLDSVMMHEGSSAYGFADGSSPNWIWNGTPNASTSSGPAS